MCYQDLKNQHYLLSCCQVPQQSLTGNDCGFYLTLSVEHFNKVKDT